MYHVIMTVTVSKHKTQKAASAALKKIKDKDGEIAMVVKMPDEKEKK